MKGKIKITIYVVAVLWIAVFTQIIVNRAFAGDTRVIEAFSKTNTKMAESGLTLTAYYGDMYLTQADKEQLIHHLATALGITTDYKLETKEVDYKVLTKASKEGKNATTEIKMITIPEEIKENNLPMETVNSSGMKQYIIIKMDIYQNRNSVLEYKKLLEKEIKKLKVQDYQTLIKFSGSYEGNLSEEERTKERDLILNSLQAKIVGETKENNYKTTYAYTELVDDYLVVDGKRMNINIVMSYDKGEDRTNLYLATPILNEDY